ncbi:MAG: PilN domain-containing protein [Deltaproteobacteria bacterium]|nr:MAG: PilN domain-containing protein [Deltaproteobacteria bacterium]
MPSAKRHVIQHINFVEKEPLTLTYRAMIMIVLMILASGGATFFIQKTRLAYLQKKVTVLESELAALKSNRDRIMTEIAKQGEKSNLSKARMTLVPFFDDSEEWSGVLKEITARIPHSMWLKDIHSTQKTGGKKSVMISGDAYQPEVVTLFIKALGSSSYFDQVILSSLEQKIEKTGNTYHFSIEMGIASKKNSAAVADGGGS